MEMQKNDGIFTSSFRASENLESLTTPGTLRTKSDTALTAQIAAFAFSPHFREASTYEDKKALRLEVPNLPTAKDHLSTSNPEQLSFRERWFPSYHSYLKSADGLHASSGLTPLLDRFDADFKDTVATIRAALARGVPSSEIPAYVGSGLCNHAFGFIHEDQEVIVRISKSSPNYIGDFRALLLSDGIPQTPRLLGLSIVEGADVMTRLSGRPLSDVPYDQRIPISEKQISDAIVVALQLGDRGLMTDTKPGNFLFCDNKGVGFIDYNVCIDAVPASVCINHLFYGLTLCRKNSYQKYSTKYKSDAEMNVRDSSGKYLWEVVDKDYRRDEAMASFHRLAWEMDILVGMLRCLAKSHPQHLPVFVTETASHRRLNESYYCERLPDFPEGSALLENVKQLDCELARFCQLR